jgi:hypothetical protein
MNDQHNPGNAQNQDSIEVRLARAAQQLDTAAANYAYRTHTDVATSATSATSASSASALRGIEPLRGTRRRFAPFAAIGGALAFAGSLLFGASVISNQAEKPPTTVPVEVASPITSVVPTSDFPFIGELIVSLPNSLMKAGTEELTFRDGVAISSIDQQRFTLTSAIDVDIDSDGVKELAVLINDAASTVDTTPTVPPAPAADAKDLKSTKSAGITKNSPSKLSTASPKAFDTSPRSTATTQPTSAVAVVRIVDGLAKTLATTPDFATHYDALLMNRKTLWAMRLLGDGSSGSGEAVLQRALITTSTGIVSWAPAESPIARTALPLIVEGDRQIRFVTGTKSALVFAAGGTRRGWFTAKAGQTLTISTIGIPSNKKRQITLLKRKGSNDQAPGINGVLPGPFTTVLPHGGDYEILVGEGSAKSGAKSGANSGANSGAETTFELSIE